MAPGSGKAVAISKLRTGDKVIATDVKTGKTGPAMVSVVRLKLVREDLGYWPTFSEEYSHKHE